MSRAVTAVFWQTSVFEPQWTREALGSEIYVQMYSSRTTEALCSGPEAFWPKIRHVTDVLALGIAHSGHMYKRFVEATPIALLLNPRNCCRPFPSISISG